MRVRLPLPVLTIKTTNMKCPDCNGRGFTLVKVGDTLVKSPCHCSNDEAKKLKEAKDRLNDYLDRERKKKEN